jgi:hypothetical protein
VPKELLGRKVSIEVRFDLAPIETVSDKIEVPLPAK